jgi:hypothetical protein
MELLQNVLDVFLHGAVAASEDFSDLAVTFSRSDPVDDFELARGERTWPCQIGGRPFVNFG